MKKEIADYFAQFDGDVRQRLAKVREIFLEEVPGCDEGIKYRMPTILWNGNLIHYAAFKSHIGVYPLPTVLEALKEETASFKQGKGSIQFAHVEPLPEDLIRKIIRLRKAEREAEVASKKQATPGRG